MAEVKRGLIAGRGECTLCSSTGGATSTSTLCATSRVGGGARRGFDFDRWDNAYERLPSSAPVTHCGAAFAAGLAPSLREQVSCKCHKCDPGCFTVTIFIGKVHVYVLELREAIKSQQSYGHFPYESGGLHRL